MSSSVLKQPFPYSLKTGAFRELGLALKAMATYREKGLSPYWTRVDLGDKGVWFRVFLGYFADEREALAFREKHGLDGAKAVKTEYAARIGSFTSEKDLAEALGSLEDLELSPYVIESPVGSVSLYVGAFVTEAGARQQVRELASQGIAAQVVHR